MVKFKSGDKVVCINNSHVVSSFSPLSVGGIYTIDEYDDKYFDYIFLLELDGMYVEDRFILLTEYRKQKIESLYES